MVTPILQYAARVSPLRRRKKAANDKKRGLHSSSKEFVAPAQAAMTSPRWHVLDMQWAAGEKLGLRVNDDSSSVTKVESNSPAQRAGLIVGDTVISVHGTGVNGTGHASELILKTVRGGKTALRLEVRRAEKPAASNASKPRKKEASPRAPAQAPKAKQPKQPAAAPAAAPPPALSSEANRLQALISGKGVDVKGDLVKRLSAGEPATVKFLSTMYPAAKTSKCLLCDKSFVPGGASKCHMLHQGEFDDYEREHAGRGEYGGTFSGTCEFCGAYVSAHGDEDDGPNDEDFGMCYCGPHVASQDAVNKLELQLRKDSGGTQ